MRRKSRSSSGREGGRFLALPCVVMESASYKALSHPAKALLMEFAYQFHGDDNGRLLCSRAYLYPRGWKSASVIHKAKQELIESGFIHETVKGHRPNKASWYAVTWQTLDKLVGYDEGTAQAFVRGAYRKIDALIPTSGTGKVTIAPTVRTEPSPSVPKEGTIRERIRYSSVPDLRHPLEVPSVGEVND